VAPKGEFIVVAGKLDPHVTVYSFDKIQKTIADKKFTTDEFGVPILDFDSTVEARVEVGLGPLHTQFDDKGYAYTSLFLDSAVARWSLGGAYASQHPEKPWTVVTKTPVQYNVGHICVPGGDTAHPDGKYLVALNKWSVDRFLQTGPLLPQNLQLLDIASGGERMPVLMDMPFGVGEPHYGEMIAASKLHSWAVYPEVAWDPHTQSVDPKAPVPGNEKVVRTGSNSVEVFMTAVRSHFNPEHVHLKQGDHVIWHITNPERAVDATHGFTLSGHNISLSLEPGETDTFEFTADKPGTYPFYCVEFCSALHLEMTGYMLVEP
jgi:nitrous-oxide reductase